jgi:transglutaminase-like putative cysteine protease
MTGRRRLGLVAASATVLASAPLSAIFETWTWLMQVILAVALIAGAAVAARTLRFPSWAQALSMVVALLLVLTWMFPSHKELLGLVPTPSTFEHFGALFNAAGADTRSYGVPVPDLKGLLFITVLGVGVVAIAVDLLTVVLRKPALAGLPMLAIYSVPVAVYVDSVPVLSFIVGAIGFLWLLVADNVDRVRRFGRRFTGDGRDVDVWEPSPLAAAGRRLAAIGVAAAVLLPLIVPGLSGGLLNRLTQSGVGTGSGFGAGGTRGLNLFSSLSGALTQGPTTDVLKVTTTEPDPFYLRFGVADVVSDNGFGNRTPSGKPLSQGLPDPRKQSATEGATFNQYHATVQVADSFSTSLAPVYSSPVGTDKLDGTWSYDPAAQVVFSNRQTTKGKKYSFDYVRASFTPAALRSAPSLPKDDATMAAFTRVPPDPAVIKLVGTLTKNQDTDYDRVSAIYRYFSAKNGFSYSLSTKSGTTGSDIANFLKYKVGYCQQYASTMAWMVRQAGIPARVAFGFTRGSSKNGDTYTLTNKNLHAWTEVYFTGFGWVPFDATPAADVAGAARSTWAPDADKAAPTATASATAAAPGANASAAAGNADRPGQANTGHDPAAVGGTTTTGGSSKPLWIAAIAALLIALLLVPALRRSLLRRRRHHATVPRTLAVGPTGPAPPGTAPQVTVTVDAVRARADAHAAWDELIDTMIDYRVPVNPAETPRTTAERLIHDGELSAAPAESATLLGRAEERARYARQPLQGGEFTEALTKVRKGLAHTVDRRTRIMAVVLPPSVTLRWRLALADASGRWMGALGDWRERTARFSPRRLLTSRAR